MATPFQPKKIVLSEINGGNQVVDGDNVPNDFFNAPVEAAAYAQDKADEANIKSDRALEYVALQTGTYVTVNGVIQNTFNADTKAPLNSPAFKGSLSIDGTKPSIAPSAVQSNFTYANYSIISGTCTAIGCTFIKCTFTTTVTFTGPSPNTFIDCNFTNTTFGSGSNSVSANITTCTGSIKISGSTAKVYISNSPNLTITYTVGATSAQVFIDGVSKIFASSGSANVVINNLTNINTSTFFIQLKESDVGGAGIFAFTILPNGLADGKAYYSFCPLPNSATNSTYIAIQITKNANSLSLICLGNSAGAYFSNTVITEIKQQIGGNI